METINLENYYQKADGTLVPASLVKPVDQMRDDVVREIFTRLGSLRTKMLEEKKAVLELISVFIETASEEYGVKVGGDKGNVTLSSFDGKIKIQRKQTSRTVYTEGVIPARELINQYLADLTKGADPTVIQIVDLAFRLKNGKVNTYAINQLRELNIEDPRWKKAMEIIDDSRRTEVSDPYLAVYVYNPVTKSSEIVDFNLATMDE